MLAQPVRPAAKRSWSVALYKVAERKLTDVAWPPSLSPCKGKLIAVDESQDPREALLKHADKDDEFSSFTAAYAKTQPKPIFAQEEEEEGA